MPRETCRLDRPRSLSAIGALLTLLLGCSAAPPSEGPPQHLNPVGVVANPTPPPIDTLPQVPADPREKLLAELSAALLTEKHVLRRPVDDALSRESFPKYLERLDGAKLM